MTKPAFYKGSEELIKKSVETLLQMLCLGWFLITAVDPSAPKIFITGIVIMLSSLGYWLRTRNVEASSVFSLLLLSTSLILIMPFYAGAHDITLFALAAPFFVSPFLVRERRLQILIGVFTVAAYVVLWTVQYLGMYEPLNPQLAVHDIFTVAIVGILISFWTYTTLRAERRITVETEYSYRFLEHLLSESNTAYLGVSDDLQIVWKSENADEFLNTDFSLQTDAGLLFPSVDLPLLQRKAEAQISPKSVRFDHTTDENGIGKRDFIVDLSAVDRSFTCPFGINMFMVISDVTDQKRDIENTLERNERFSVISRISHELRNPLHGMLAHAQLLGEDSSLSESQSKHVRMIERSTLHLRNVINEVLDYSKIESGHMNICKEWIDIIELAEDVTNLYEEDANSRGLSLSLAVTPEVQTIKYYCTDPTKYRQIFGNLVSNAVKYTECGWVKIKLELTHHTSDSSTDTAEELTNSTLRLTVSDSGGGIPPEDCFRIFEPFQQVDGNTRKVEGTGLGLPIAKRIAEALGGTLELESIVGIGSRFILSIPYNDSGFQNILSSQQMALELTKASGDVHEVKLTETSEPIIPLAEAGTIEVNSPDSQCTSMEPKNGGNEYRILIVDDSEMNRSLLIEVFEGSRCNIEIAVDGDDAVQKAEQWSPDLIFMDLRMPKMNGIEATKLILQSPACSKTRIFGCTASAFREDELNFLNAGVEKVIKKPFDISEILAIVEDNKE